MYFYFSPSERKGIILLSGILVLIIFAPSLYRYLKPRNDLKITINQLAELDSLSKKVGFSESENITQDPFVFDPNTATDNELKQLGFSDKNIATLKNYLSKGGKIKSIEGLKKIYGIDTSLVNKLSSYIQIENSFQSKKSFADSAKVEKKKIVEPLELNSADSVSLVKLYRIGPTLASKIIAYRKQLGGFLNLNQLNEIWGFDEDILFDLQGKIYVDANKANRINLNTVTENELKTHPYFKYKLARILVNYRNQHGRFSNFNDLLKIKVINDSILSRIKIYGVIE
ncbi:MAG: ComEA family DNA-binding protein [Bacteroidia bacterium]